MVYAQGYLFFKENLQRLANTFNPEQKLCKIFITPKVALATLWEVK